MSVDRELHQNRTDDKLILCSSASYGDHYRILCPKCGTFCSLVLKQKSGATKMHTFWMCGTLKCGFRREYPCPEQQTAQKLYARHPAASRRAISRR